MAKRAKKKAKKSKKAKKAKQAKKARKAKGKRVTAAKRKTAATRKPAAKKKAKKRAPRRTEADMTWAELRQSRRKKSEGREDRIRREFDRAVNMTPQAIEKWLGGPQSKDVGSKPSEGAESVGHWSGRRIIEIKKKKDSELTPADFAHMRKVSAYVKRHGAQRPEGDIKETPWRYSLMNWGHDPLK
jgi:hypothetical protein